MTARRAQGFRRCFAVPPCSQPSFLSVCVSAMRPPRRPSRKQRPLPPARPGYVCAVFLNVLLFYYDCNAAVKPEGVEADQKRRRRGAYDRAASRRPPARRAARAADAAAAGGVRQSEAPAGKIRAGALTRFIFYPTPGTGTGQACRSGIRRRCCVRSCV